MFSCLFFSGFLHAMWPNGFNTPGEEDKVQETRPTISAAVYKNISTSAVKQTHSECFLFYLFSMSYDSWDFNHCKGTPSQRGSLKGLLKLRHRCSLLWLRLIASDQPAAAFPTTTPPSPIHLLSHTCTRAVPDNQTTLIAQTYYYHFISLFREDVKVHHWLFDSCISARGNNVACRDLIFQTFPSAVAENHLLSFLYSTFQRSVRRKLDFIT